MDNILSVLTPEESVYLTLRALYSSYGYKKYRMAKFEEYDLYAKNKDYLVSENVITFTDTDGKLMALKPDVTLSIVKNSKDVDGVMKVYYDENVYRVSKGTKSFKEIMQSGLECIGAVTQQTVQEVLLLASKSLAVISDSFVLSVSHLDIIKEVLKTLPTSESENSLIIKYLSERNLPAIKAFFDEKCIVGEGKDAILSIASLYGSPKKVASELKKFKISKSYDFAVSELLSVTDNLENAVIDFSVVNDLSYYNGIAFKGFIEGVPTSVISGGEYDNLMKKMNKPYKALGFAVYLDEISRIKGE
jgi:ATP phosphoribosyltransferase regulatory subunit